MLPPLPGPNEWQVGLPTEPVGSAAGGAMVRGKGGPGVLVCPTFVRVMLTTGPLLRKFPFRDAAGP